MRSIVRFVACVAIAVVAASCGNPMLERKYINEGAGVDLYSGDAANQIALLNQYIAFICLQMGQPADQQVCAVASHAFVQAGMNDIDQRCDGYLTWLDARRRDQTPVLAEISAIEGATHDIMAITGSSVKSLNIVTTAFTLATQTYTNWNSRLLISVNQSTVQEVVYTSQAKYRDKVRNTPVPDQPTAIYLLRNYLRLCMPITIEATINTSTTFVQRDLPPQDTQPLVVQSTVPPRVAPPVIHANTPPPVTQPPPKILLGAITDLEKKSVSQADGQAFQRTLCIDDGGNFGQSGSATRQQLQQFYVARLYPKDASAHDTIVATNELNWLRDAQAVFPSCKAAGLKNGFEVGLFSRPDASGLVDPMKYVGQIVTALNKEGIDAPPVLTTSTTLSSAVVAALREVIPKLRDKYKLPGDASLDRALYNRIAHAGSR